MEAFGCFSQGEASFHRAVVCWELRAWLERLEFFELKFEELEEPQDLRISIVYSNQYTFIHTQEEDIGFVPPRSETRSGCSKEAKGPGSFVSTNLATTLMLVHAILMVL